MTLNKKGIINTLISIIIMSILIVFDQFTKKLAVAHLMNKEPYRIIDGVFELRYLENRGAAFGMMQNQKIIFVIIAAIMLLAVLYFLYNIPSDKKYIILRICMILIGAGAVGNLIDRLSQSFVVDFLYFILIDFPIFNVADIYVSVSCVILVICVLFYYKEEDFNFLKIKKEDNGKI